MPDNILEIGTIVDTSGLVSGLRQGVAVVQSNTAEMATAFQELSATGVEAGTAMTQAFAAPTASIEVLATSIAKSSLRSAEALEAIASSGRRMGVAVKESSEEAGLGLDHLRERAVLTSEGFRLSAYEMGGFLSGFGALLGIGFVGEMLDHVALGAAHATTELSHLSEATGINVADLQALQLAAGRSGVEFDRIQLAVQRFARFVSLAEEGSKTEIGVLKAMGVSVADLHGKYADFNVLFEHVMNVLGGTEAGFTKTGLAMQIFGRGAGDLAGGLREVADNAGQAKKDLEEMGGVLSDKDVAAARQLETASANLSAHWRTALLPVMQELVTAGKYLYEGFLLSRLGIDSFINVLIADVHAAQDMAVPVLKMIADLMSGNFKAAAADANAAMDAWGSDIALGMMQVRDEADATDKSIQSLWKDIETPPKPKGKIDIGGITGSSSRIAEWENELNQRKLALDAFHTVSVADEIAFWEQIKNTHKLTVQEQNAIDSKLVELRKSLSRQDVEQMIAAEREKIAATRAGSAERLTLEQDLYNKLKALAAGGTGTVSPELANQIAAQAARVAAVQEAMSEKEKQLALSTEMAKVAATKQGTTQRLLELQRYVDLAATLFGQESTQYAEAQRRMSQEQLRAQEERQLMAQQEVKSEEQLALLRLQNEKQAYDARIPAFAKSSGAVLAQEQAFARQEYEIKREALEQSLTLLSQDPNTSPAKMAAIKQQLLILEQQYYNQRDAIAQRSFNIEKTLEEQFAHTLQSSFASGLSGIITGTETLQHAWLNLTRNMLTSFIQSLTEMGIKWLMTHTLMQVTSNTANAAIGNGTAALYAGLAGLYAQDVGAFTAALTTRKALLSAADVAEVGSYAAVAAAGEFAYYAAIDPPIAPAMAAQAFAEVMGYAPAAAFAERGAVLPSDMLVYAHAKEMILPAPISSGLQQMIQAGATTTTSTSTANNNFNLSYHAGAGAGAASSVDARRFADMLQRELRRRNIYPA